jgi:hypothetical protein
MKSLNFFKLKNINLFIRIDGVSEESEMRHQRDEGRLIRALSISPFPANLFLNCHGSDVQKHNRASRGIFLNDVQSILQRQLNLKVINLLLSVVHYKVFLKKRIKLTLKATLNAAMLMPDFT